MLTCLSSSTGPGKRASLEFAWSPALCRGATLHAAVDIALLPSSCCAVLLCGRWARLLCEDTDHIQFATQLMQRLADVPGTTRGTRAFETQPVLCDPQRTCGSREHRRISVPGFQSGLAVLLAGGCCKHSAPYSWLPRGTVFEARSVVLCRTFSTACCCRSACISMPTTVVEALEEYQRQFPESLISVRKVQFSRPHVSHRQDFQSARCTRVLKGWHSVQITA